MPDLNRGRALLGAPVPRLRESPFVIFDLVAFVAVVSLSLAPRMAFPVIRCALLLYAMGVGP